MQRTGPSVKTFGFDPKEGGSTPSCAAKGVYMETKICTKCQRELPLEDFHWRNKAKGTRRSECKDCHNGYMKIIYKDKVKSLQNIKANIKCAKCGESRGYVLDFHHKDPTVKEDTIARMTSNKYTLDKIQEEIDKCVVLCSNCHREFHYLSNSSNLTLDEYLKD